MAERGPIPQSEKAYDDLNKREQYQVDRLVDEYLSNGFVQWRAYRDTLYAGKNPDYDHVSPIAARKFQEISVRERLEARLKEAAMSADEALYRLTEQARNEVMRYLSTDGTVDLERLIEDGKAHLVKETDYKGKNADRLVVRFHDVQSAIDKILKAHGTYGAKGTEDDPIKNIHEVNVHIINEPQNLTSE